MDTYINNFELFKESIVYDFRFDYGGIGDCIKFFMCSLELCMKDNVRLYYKQNNMKFEKYIKLKYDKMYINEDTIKQLDNVKIITPYIYHNSYDYNIHNIIFKDVFYFTDEVKINSTYLLPLDIKPYISIHLRLGDKFLEIEQQYILCKEDIRIFSEERIYKFIEDNYSKNIFFCCDNNNYKLKLKEKYNNIIITNCDIGHTTLRCTTEKQVLDAITEFYILTNSEMIFAAANSGFSIVASKFNNIPLILQY